MAAVAVPIPFSTPAVVAADPNGMNLHSQSPSSTSEAVYTTLIQTYLNLLCYDNALFLAERNAAAFPQSENAIYLLAYCHYRNGSPKSARSILIHKWMMMGGKNNDDLAATSMGSGGHDNNNNTSLQLLERTRSSARYLLAKSCYDLGLYGEAEETLLLPCRTAFARAVSEGGGTVHGVKIRGSGSNNRNEAMDAWIVNTTTTLTSQGGGTSSSRPCPIPNGSAGLYLLGNICRKTNRRQRAIEYYRLSLKLDPLMWMSYEAICELGGPAAGTSDEADDPNTIFGVPAPTLSPTSRRDIGASMMGHHHGFVCAATAASTVGGGDRAMENQTVQQQQQQQQPLHSFHLNRYGTPSTPYSGFGKMNIGTYTNISTAAAAQQEGGGGGGGGGSVNFHGPATASTIAPRSRGRLEDSALPQTNLFAATPALATSTAQPPSIRLGVDETPFPTMTDTDDDNNHRSKPTIPPSAIMGYANHVIDRARRVVDGQTYEASPESMNFPATTQRRTRFATELTFSSTPLPISPMPNIATVPFHAGVSTVKGEKRTLLFMNEGAGDRTPTSSSRTKSPKKEESQKEETTQTRHEEGIVDHSRVPVLSSTTTVASMSGDGGQQLRLDTMTESDHVGKVLELLCGIGAAYKYLCQASH
jgi:tetratricopeptide (TPR) repeat protein